MTAHLAKATKIAIRSAIQTSKTSVEYHHTTGVRNFVAGFGAMQVGQDGLDGQMIRVTDSDRRDLIAWPSDVPFEPSQGDVVIVTLPEGKQVRFKVSSYNAEPHWRWTDRFETARRIHLKESPQNG